ncbi:hypothetical protein F5884DRAFT_760516 [Xylogone sp. PMI_703]|nr:hypothetical protein F5884DRAFT_760516 [Xylogone sp. PMI_703]
MAGDTRDSSSSAANSLPTPPPGATAPPEHIQNAKPKIYEVFHSSSPTAASTGPENANQLPLSASQNTAGSKSKELEPTFTNALKTVRLGDFKQVHMYPCVRDSLLTGIGAGFGVGGIRALLGAPIPKATNWAASSFVLLSFASYEYCLYKRTLEKAQVKRAVEIIDRKKAEREAQMQAAREERRRKKEEEERRIEEARNKSWWKVW